MLSKRAIESSVGLFLILSIIALAVLAVKVSGLTSLLSGQTYLITAEFDDIGGLKVRSPVKMAGVPIGVVSHISLNPQTFKAMVTMQLEARYNTIPDDSSARILTAGLLGDNYIAITPLYSKTTLRNNMRLTDTVSAMGLEKLVGQFLFNVKK